MSSVKKLAVEIASHFNQILPGLRKVLRENLPIAIAAMIEAKTVNTSIIATYLPLDLARTDLREQWFRRLLSNKFLVPHEVMAPFAQQVLQNAASHGEIIQLRMNQMEIGGQFIILTISLRIGDYALPLTWWIETNSTHIGFETQRILLERILTWLAEAAQVMLCTDRVYPCENLFKWLKTQNWQYRLPLKSHYLTDLGKGTLERREYYETDISLFQGAVTTNIGIFQQPGHKEPWIIAMDCKPSRAKFLDYNLRWCIEPISSNFKSCDFGLEKTHLQDTKRLDNLLLVMALAMYWCITSGHDNI